MWLGRLCLGRCWCGRGYLFGWWGCGMCLQADFAEIGLTLSSTLMLSCPTERWVDQVYGILFRSVICVAHSLPHA